MNRSKARRPYKLFNNKINERLQEGNDILEVSSNSGKLYIIMNKRKPLDCILPWSRIHQVILNLDVRSLGHQGR